MSRMTTMHKLRRMRERWEDDLRDIRQLLPPDDVSSELVRHMAATISAVSDVLTNARLEDPRP